MKQELHNYGRSNHNLSCARITSAAPGVLYPLYTTMGLTGDTFDIDLKAFCRTLPTEGPMFGAFKLQVDVFSADARLYQAILHNNTTEIGLDMDKVLLPKIKLNTQAEWEYDNVAETWRWKQQISKSSLMYYLGLSGIAKHQLPTYAEQVSRKFNALPILAYYDIFKNYYSNKQEENAYVIASTPDKLTLNPKVNSIKLSTAGGDNELTLDRTFTIMEEDNPASITINGQSLYVTDNGIFKPTVQIARNNTNTPVYGFNYSTTGGEN